MSEVLAASRGACSLVQLPDGQFTDTDGKLDRFNVVVDLRAEARGCIAPNFLRPDLDSWVDLKHNR